MQRGEHGALRAKGRGLAGGREAAGNGRQKGDTYRNLRLHMLPRARPKPQGEGESAASAAPPLRRHRDAAGTATGATAPDPSVTWPVA